MNMFYKNKVKYRRKQLPTPGRKITHNIEVFFFFLFNMNVFSVVLFFSCKCPG